MCSTERTVGRLRTRTLPRAALLTALRAVEIGHLQIAPGDPVVRPLCSRHRRADPIDRVEATGQDNRSTIGRETWARCQKSVRER